VGSSVNNNLYSPNSSFNAVECFLLNKNVVLGYPSLKRL